MRTDTPISDRRRRARAIILQVIEDNVLGPVQTLPKGDILELRSKLRDAYPWGERRHWPYKVWCEEVRSALGYIVRKASRRPKPRRYRASQVMPSMREWAAARGLLADEEIAP